MVEDIRLVTYLNALDQELDEDLRELEQYAREEQVPIIRKETQSFLRLAACDKAANKDFGGGHRNRIFRTFDGAL